MNAFHKAKFFLSGLLLLAMACGRTPSHYGKLPPFALKTQLAQPFTQEDLRGKVWVAGFIYTGCEAMCPRLTGQMGSVLKTISAPDFHLVSITVDPETDTVSRLADYAKRFEADPARWHFLTGDVQAVQDVVIKGFGQAMNQTAPGAIFHSERLVLVDKQGEMRGFYEITPSGLKSLEAAIWALLRE